MSKKHAPQSADDLCGISFASNLLGCSQATTKRYTDKGLLPSVRDSSGKRLIRRGDIETFKRARRA